MKSGHFEILTVFLLGELVQSLGKSVISTVFLWGRGTGVKLGQMGHFEILTVFLLGGTGAKLGQICHFALRGGGGTCVNPVQIGHFDSIFFVW